MGVKDLKIFANISQLLSKFKIKDIHNCYVMKIYVDLHHHAINRHLTSMLDNVLPFSHLPQYKAGTTLYNSLNLRTQRVFHHLKIVSFNNRKGLPDL